MTHLKRTSWTILLVSLALAAFPAQLRAEDAPEITRALQSESALARRINELRRTQGLRPLAISSDLTRAAAAHADSMARQGYFSHDSADGSSFSERIRGFFSPRGRSSWSVGETLYFSDGTAPAGSVVQAWLESPPHKRILLASGWRAVGVGVVRAENAGGIFGGLDVTIVVADFGARS